MKVQEIEYWLDGKEPKTLIGDQPTLAMIKRIIVLLKTLKYLMENI